MLPQITSTDIFSLPENIDKKFAIPIIIFCCSTHSFSSNNRVSNTIYSTGTQCNILCFCSTKILLFICFVGLVSVKLVCESKCSYLYRLPEGLDRAPNEFL